MVEEHDMGMKLRGWKDVIFMDFPKMAAVSEKAVRQIKQDSKSYRGSVRLATGKILTDKEYEKRTNTLRQKPLP